MIEHTGPMRLPSDSPQRNVIERFWRVLRRRATHNRLCASMAVLRTTLRNNLCYFQTMRQQVLSLIESLRKAKKEAKLALHALDMRLGFACASGAACTCVTKMRQGTGN